MVIRMRGTASSSGSVAGTYGVTRIGLVMGWGRESEVFTMPGSLMAFFRNSGVWRKPGVLAVTALLGVALVALCVIGALHITGGASAARPTPRVGERLSVFTDTYGQPAKLGTDRGLKVGQLTISGVRFFVDKAQTIIVDAQQTHGIVTNLVVTGPSSWTKQQSFAYCQTFLPIGATSERTVGQYTYFHSSLGDVVINNAGSGTCEVLIMSGDG
jgi:hypothetical protein